MILVHQIPQNRKAVFSALQPLSNPSQPVSGLTAPDRNSLDPDHGDKLRCISLETQDSKGCLTAQKSQDSWPCLTGLHEGFIIFCNFTDLTPMLHQLKLKQ